MADANRSCGPPKPGAASENQADGAAGGPPGGRRGPTGPRMARGDAAVCPRGPNINCAPIQGPSSDLSDDYMLRAALKGTYLCLREN